MGFSGVQVRVKDFVPQKNPYPRHGYGGLAAGLLSIDLKKL